VIDSFLKRDVNLRGADLLYGGNIPHGAGLSSSASIELVTAIALQALSDVPWSRIELVQLAQQAENDFVGVNCGIMDQFAVGMGQENHAMLLRCDTLFHRHVPLNLDRFKLVIANTNKRRGLIDSKYNERRQECEEAYRLLADVLPGLGCLGEVTEEQFQAHAKVIESPVIRKRLEHVVRENARVLRSASALENGDLKLFGQYMRESHQSLRSLYEVTGPELDALYDAAVRAEGCIGSRMTGAGFGGCTVSLVHEDAVASFLAQVGGQYAAKTGLTADFYLCAVGAGAREVTEEVQAWRS